MACRSSRSKGSRRCASCESPTPAGETRAHHTYSHTFSPFPYPTALRPPAGFVNSLHNRSTTDFTNNTSNCMNVCILPVEWSGVEWSSSVAATVVLLQEAFQTRSLARMVRCWSSATAFDNFPKSGDFAGSIAERVKVSVPTHCESVTCCCAAVLCQGCVRSTTTTGRATA